jgi:hypothetical protein
MNPPCNCTNPPCEGCPTAARLCDVHTSITYHGDNPSYPYRVVENGLWIASVASYSTGDQVLTGLALARIYVNVLARLDAPHACPSCGDLTIADICAACTEVDYSPLDVDFAPIGWI